MSKSNTHLLLLCLAVTLCICACQSKGADDNLSKPVAYPDIPFEQEVSIKYPFETPQEALKVSEDRNGVIQVLTREGLFRPHGGAFLYPGKLVKDRTYRALSDKKLRDMVLYQEQFVYLDSMAVLSNAWAGKLFDIHGVAGARIVSPSERFTFLVAGKELIHVIKANEIVWKINMPEKLLMVKYNPALKTYYLLSETAIFSLDEDDGLLTNLYSSINLTCFDFINGGQKIAVGTADGYFTYDLTTNKASTKNSQLPCPAITSIKNIDGSLWLGSDKGAFRVKKDGRFDYYFGDRWLVGQRVIDIAKAKNGQVLLLTDKGLSKLDFNTQTLYEKAMYFEDQVRNRHIRFGFNATLGNMEKGNVDTGMLKDSDNDGLWTAMYLAGQAFRYGVNGDAEALENCRESLDAMERLYTINPVEGFPSRSFNRSGYKEHLSDPERWQRSDHPEWDWKATTSSDEAIGHVFAFGVLAEVVKVPAIRNKAIQLLDALMQHVVDHDYYLVDYDGKPTLWGKWNPDYVNGFPPMVGDRKLNSSNIIAMLQTAYHFTKKEIYKEKAFELMEDHGYLQNLMVPMEDIGKATEDSDDWAEMLSQSWNHSDDEMYFLGYWGLYRYAFNDSLKTQYKTAIKDHWEAERPEKDGLWNIFTAMVSPDDFDQEEAIWYLKQYPMDLIDWTMVNSHRKDIVMLDTNFREQATAKVLPPDELRIRRHNANRFALDGGGEGKAEYSAGDIWLLPYWMGRYLGLISGSGEDIRPI
ncbi:hypothetical protein FKX85_16340 [Echinicola soli]|uniref:Uncharacterized protein n=1 Tax=Echinicola soli TaxID=2591634 RepID=A0A514CL23_9BACT|nr:hypothetical protein [Echinicola soli]QDH80523.1 hypothetical protein FKX85_16340 [Echinicola soli]